MPLQAYDFYHPSPASMAANCKSAAAINGETSRRAWNLSAKNWNADAWGLTMTADHQSRRHEVWKNRERNHLARSQTHQCLSVLPILDQHRRPRRRPLFEILHFLDRKTINELASVTTSAPEQREAQRRLAREVTASVHGVEHVQRAERASSTRGK